MMSCVCDVSVVCVCLHVWYVWPVAYMRVVSGVCYVCVLSMWCLVCSVLVHVFLYLCDVFI